MKINWLIIKFHLSFLFYNYVTPSGFTWGHGGQHFAIIMSPLRGYFEGGRLKAEGGMRKRRKAEGGIQLRITNYELRVLQSRKKKVEDRKKFAFV